MALLKDLQKSIKTHHVLALFGLVVLGVVFMQYSNRKGSIVNPMSNLDRGANVNPSAAAAAQQQYVSDVSGPSTGAVSPANPAGQN